MASARHHARLSAPADEVWALVREPAGIKDWLPGIDDVTMEGDDVRVVSAMGAEIKERCSVHDDLRRFEYTITESPLGLSSHLATVDVLDDGDASVVVYACMVDPGDGLAIFDGIAKGACDALVARFGAG